VPVPSPNQLKYKILIKNKRLNPEDEKRKNFWRISLFSDYDGAIYNM